MNRIKKIAKRFDVVRFAVVGAMNTALDFTILNILITLAHMPIVPANIVSTSLVMIFSFKANSKLVFTAKSSRRRHHQAVLFLLGTLFGLYVLQTFVIALLAHWWTTPVEFVGRLLSIDAQNELFVANAAKLVATASSMIWNYCFYKFVVFKEEK